jgi:hypothetical protein
VADVAADNTLLSFDQDGRPAAAIRRLERFGGLQSWRTGGVRVVRLCDETRLLAWLRRRLVDHHLAPAIHGLLGAAGVTADLLWDEAADVCAAAFERAHAISNRPEQVVADAVAFFSYGSPLNGRGRFTVVGGDCGASLSYIRARRVRRHAPLL